MASNQYLYKPTSERNGNLVILTPNMWNDKIDQVELVDAQGNVIEQGRFDGNEHNGARGDFRFSKPGSAYGSNVTTRITFTDGRDPMNIAIADGGARYEQNIGNGGADLPGANPIYDAEGNITAYAPTNVDYGAIQPANVSYEESLARAQQAGTLATDQFYGNIERSQDPALSLVGTDIAGIQQGLDVLGPRAREEGRADLRENIGRASDIDQFNFSRLEGINAFNRQLTEQSNVFNEGQQRRAEESAGLGYRQRINDLLDRLENRAETGRMGADFDEAMDASIAGRASDIAGASGVSAISGAGVRARDRMMIGERINLALGAESALPGVLQNAQASLQFQPERAPTAYAQPTQVPLNPSRIEERMPVQSSISAGQAQLGIAGTATQLQAIPATTALTSSLATEQFNAQAAFTRDVMVADQTQNQNNMASRIGQGIVNAETAAEIRDQQLAAAREGLEIREQADLTQGLLGFGGSVVEEFGSDIVDWATGGGTTAPTTTASPASPPPSSIGGQAVVGSAPTSTGDPGYLLSNGDVVPQAKVANYGSVGGSARRSTQPSGKFSTPNPVVNTLLNSPGDTGAVTNGVADFINKEIGGNPETSAQLAKGVKVGNATIRGEDFIRAMTESGGLLNGAGAGYESTPTGFSKGAGIAGKEEASDLVERRPAEELAPDGDNWFDRVTKPNQDVGIDSQLMAEGVQTLQSWNDTEPSSRVESAGSMGVSTLENSGAISTLEASDIRSGISAATTLFDPSASDAQRVSAMATMTADLATTSFTGDVGAPTTIGGQAVTNSVAMPNGEAGFQLEDGRIVSQATLSNTADIMAGVQALGVITGNAADDQKVRALAGLGISTATAHNIINEVAGGNIMAGLAIINTVSDWDQMSNIQRGISVATTSHAVYDAAANMGGRQALEAAGSSALEFLPTTIGGESVADIAGSIGTGLHFVTAGYGLYRGIDQAADVFSAVDDMSEAHAVSAGVIGAGTAGAQIGAAIGSVIPVLGTAIGTAVGAQIGSIAGAVAGVTGTGKNTGQLRRDSWRDGMMNAGFSSKDHMVTLADGSEYNIGVDGGHKLTNKDGTERHSFDIDWSDEVATESIPAANLFAIATGLDPTSSEDHGLFTRAVGQSLNAASSNADTVEGTRANFKSMMDKAEVDPRHLGMRIETLRATNKITDQEYGIYLDQVNKMYGTKLQPTGIDKSRQSIVDMIRMKPQDSLTAFDRNLLEELTDPGKISDSTKALEKRLAKERENRRRKK